MKMTDLPYQYLLVKAAVDARHVAVQSEVLPGIRVWRRLPLPVTQAIGPLISRHLT